MERFISSGQSLAGVTMNPLDKQVAGDHYKDMPIQPVEYIHANAIGYFEGILYLS